MNFQKPPEVTATLKKTPRQIALNALVMATMRFTNPDHASVNDQIPADQLTLLKQLIAMLGNETDLPDSNQVSALIDRINYYYTQLVIEDSIAQLISFAVNPSQFDKSVS